MGFIFMTILIDVIGLGIIIPVVPRLITELTGQNTSEVARIGGWLTFAYAGMQFLCSPLMGNLSDRFGRRPILLLSLLGFAADYVLVAFAPNLFWLYIGRIIAGFTGASFTTASAYIADVSTNENRAKNFGLLGAAFGLGFVLGPLMGGLLVGYGTRVPFLVAGGLCLLNALYGYFILPESLQKEHRRPFEWRRSNPLGALKHLRKYPAIGGLIISLTLIYIGSHAVQSNWTYFTIEKFRWPERTIGYSLAAFGVLIMAVQGGLIRVVGPRLGNERSVYIGLALYALGMLLFAMASKSWMMFAFMVPYCLGGIAGPALQAIISGQVPSNEQGELQGALTSLMSFTSIIGPPVMTGLFYAFTHPGTPVHFSGAPFLLGAILFTISAVIAFRALHTPRVQLNETTGS